MRSLLVDNYDSFTYNLFHHLAAVNGAEPEVVTNDDPRWHPRMLREFDNVVISPGPGTPVRRADFGICADIITGGVLPLLGVCLGHQGIAHAYGARIERAPEPRHGRLSEVRHTGDELFAGIPSPLTVVRYHSLVATSLPTELVTIATTDDLVMGVRHRHRPQWGVQFHPESVSSDFGRELLANFRDLTVRRQRSSGRRTRPGAQRWDPPASGTVGAPPVRRAVIRTREVPFAPSSEAVFAEMFSAQPSAFWLDSSDGGATGGRFSMMGDATGPYARTVRADVRRGTVTVTSAEGEHTADSGFFDWLEDDLARWRIDGPDLPFDFRLGWVGYLGYELKAETGGDLAHQSPHPDAEMIFSDRAVVIDHRTGVAHLLALAVGGEQNDGGQQHGDGEQHGGGQQHGDGQQHGGGEQHGDGQQHGGGAQDGEGEQQGGGERDGVEAWLDRTAARLRAVREPGPPGAVPGTELRLRHDRDAYLERIDACRSAIGDGETYEVCLTNMVEATVDLDPWATYRRLRRISRAPFSAYLRFPEVSVLSTSPERFLRVDADGGVESKPIKGTRPRHEDPAEDERLRHSLEVNEKDRSENLMIVDLVRNDLGRCAEVGSVHVPALFATETYDTVHQLVSTVRARLRPGVGAVAAVRAAFPGGSMTGAPKVRTMQLIDRLEGAARGVYSGAIGYFSLSGTADLSIVIRTLVTSSGVARYGVGGAIVALSDADDEFEETAVKARPLLELLGAEFPGRLVRSPSTPAGRTGAGRHRGGVHAGRRRRRGGPPLRPAHPGESAHE